MPYPARQYLGKVLENPFPGIDALERTLGRSIISRLSGNEALALYPSQWLRTYREDFLNRCREYPDPAAHGLRQTLSRLKGVSSEDLLVDAGIDSLLHLALRAFTNSGDSVLCSQGTYPTFEYFARSLGLEVRHAPYAGTSHDLHCDLPGLLAAAWDIRPKVLYLANPDNPTGHAHDAIAIEAFARALPADTLLLLDEAYLDFADQDDAAAQTWPNTLRLRSFSKAYGLAGLRIGYAQAPAELLKFLLQARIHYSVSHIALWLAEQAVEDSQHATTLRDETLLLRERFQQRARETGRAFIPSHTNFVTLPLSSPEAANRLQWTLLELGVAVSKPNALNGQALIRVTLQPDVFVPQISSLIFTPSARALP